MNDLASNVCGEHIVDKNTDTTNGDDVVAAADEVETDDVKDITPTATLCYSKRPTNPNRLCIYSVVGRPM